MDDPNQAANSIIDKIKKLYCLSNTKNKYGNAIINSCNRNEQLYKIWQLDP